MSVQVGGLIALAGAFGLGWYLGKRSGRRSASVRQLAFNPRVIQIKAPFKVPKPAAV